jgi:chitinase
MYEDENGTLHPGGPDQVRWQGATWEANYWNYDHNPMFDIPGDTGAWKQVSGTLVTDPVKPDAPLNLKAGFTSDDTISMFWDPAEVKGIGTVTHYNIFVDGVKVGVSSTNNFSVGGLDPNHTYAITVTAVNSTGASPLSTALNVTTKPGDVDSGKTYSPYIDMTLPHVNLIDLARDSGVKDVTLAFMQSSREFLDAEGNLDLQAGETPSLGWGGIDNTTLPTGVIVDQVKAIQALGGTVTVAFGGYTGREAAVVARQYAEYLDANGLSATDAMDKAVEHLTREYQAVIDTYGVQHLDFDVENAVFNYWESNLYPIVNDTVANHMRNLAINNLERANGDLHISFTLPVTVNGFRSEPDQPGGDVLYVLQQAVADGVNIDVVNIMAMDYFDGDPDPQMGAKAIAAATAVHNQLLAIGLDAKVGIVPMIGVNDNLTEIFDLADAQEVLDFANSTDWVENIGIWQLPRDRPSPLKDNTGTTLHPISTGSGINAQDAWEFSKIFQGVTHQSVDVANLINGDDNPNILFGFGGNDTINGSLGNDTISGGADNDVLDGGAGTMDIVDYSDKSANVKVTLKGANINSTVKVGGANEDTIKNFEGVIGGNGKDKITGNSAANWFDGGGGKDTIKGGGGKDTFVFKVAPSASNIDKIDFKPDQDIIALDDAIFAKLGVLSNAKIHIVKSGQGHAAADNGDRLIYNKVNGQLWYDANGAKDGGDVQIAVLTAKPALIDAGDFMVV